MDQAKRRKGLVFQVALIHLLSVYSRKIKFQESGYVSRNSINKEQSQRLKGPLFENVGLFVSFC
jgi:hypothetical protein